MSDQLEIDAAVSSETEVAGDIIQWVLIVAVSLCCPICIIICIVRYCRNYKKTTKSAF